MITRNLVRRLERLEGQMVPPRDVHLLNIVFVDTDGTEVGGYTVGPGYGSRCPDAEGQGRASRAEWGVCLRNERSL
jgi:hypothetical protein